MPSLMSILRQAVAACGLVCVSLSAPADVTVYENGNTKVELGGRIQVQYVREDPDGGDASDDILFRRLRPYVEATVTEDWIGKIEVDFGKAIEGDEVAVKDAFMSYTGWQNVELTIGNAKTPFSREFLTSSKRQQTVERGFVGDHNYGTPDRQLGVRLDGQNAEKRVTWAAALGFEQHDPDARKIDFDSPANDQDDWNEGIVAAARVDFHPWGYQKFDQGDFARSESFTANFSIGGYLWSNDDDNNSYTDASTRRSSSSSKADLDEASGIELSAGLRGRGISVDAEFQRITADTVDGMFTGGVYRSGTTDLDKYQLEGGYLFPGKRVELVGKIESQDADNYADSWDAIEVGANYFWNQHKTKMQVTWRTAENVDGERGVDQDTLYVQFQFVF